MSMLIALLAGAAEPQMPIWMAGAWTTAGKADEWSEEWWTTPRAGIMLGASRSGKSAALGFFEHMRIVQDAAGLSFCAMPQGQAGTCFKAIEIADGSITFENAAHDYPTRITYRREQGGLSAEISGPGGARKQQWRYVPIGN